MSVDCFKVNMLHIEQSSDIMMLIYPDSFKPVIESNFEFSNAEEINNWFEALITDLGLTNNNNNFSLPENTTLRIKVSSQTFAVTHFKLLKTGRFETRYVLGIQGLGMGGIDNMFSIKIEYVSTNNTLTLTLK